MPNCSRRCSAESSRTPTQCRARAAPAAAAVRRRAARSRCSTERRRRGQRGAGAGLLEPGDPRVAAALAEPEQTYKLKGADGTTRVWGFSQIEGKPLVVAFGIPGAAVYGPAEDALTRDIWLAFGASVLALLAAFVLGRQLTAPIRRLAARVGHGDDAHDIGAIERGVDRMGETITETQLELAHKAERLEHVLEQRNQANEELRRLNEELEHRVAVRTAQLQEANHELEAFSYSVSHDLRAPLRAIDGFSRILVDEHTDGLSVDALRYLGLVRKNTLQMGELIDGLLALAHLGHQPVDKRLDRRRGAGRGPGRRRARAGQRPQRRDRRSSRCRRSRPTRPCYVRSTRTCSPTR